jgi:hypothetical protein
VTSSGSIRRPLDEVRQQFADMAYHAAAGVHAGVRFTIVSQDEPTAPSQLRVRRIRQRSSSARPKSAVRSFEPF